MEAVEKNVKVEFPQLSLLQFRLFFSGSAEPGIAPQKDDYCQIVVAAELTKVGEEVEN